MATITTGDIRIKNAQNLRRSLLGETVEDLSFVFVGKPTPWENEEEPPKPINNLRQFYDTHDEMIGMKRIRPSDVHLMAPRIRWTSGVVYDIYRHDYSKDNRSYSGATLLSDAIYYVINSNYEVYACLFNNTNRKSTVEPHSNNNIPFYTSDGYQWLKLYTITQGQLDVYGTENFMPVPEVAENAGIVNPIYTIIIDIPGNSYTPNPAGSNNRVNEYYCNIVGDGEGAVAAVKVRDGEIKTVRVVRPGEGYTWAELDFRANHVYEKLTDLDNNMNGLNPLGDGTFKTTVIINPPGGWGNDIQRQLGAHRVGVFSTLSYKLMDLHVDVKFRQIGILQRPESDQRLPVDINTLSACYAIKVDPLTGPDDFVVGETIRQVIDNGDGTESIALATLISWDPDEGVLRYIQIPSEHNNYGTVTKFDGIKPIIGLTSEKSVTAQAFSGYNSDLLFVDGYADPEFKKYSGYITYLTNVKPIQRVDNQTERISLIISF